MTKKRLRSAVQLSERQKRILEQYIARRSSCIGQRRRIQIILGTCCGKSKAVLAQELDMDPKMVSRWRSRWIEAYDALSAFEASKDGQVFKDSELLAKMLEVLSDRPRTGKPNRITLAQKQQIVALACEEPEDYGLPLTHWTSDWLAKVAMQRNIVEQISPRYVRELLKNQRASTA